MAASWRQGSEAAAISKKIGDINEESEKKNLMARQRGAMKAKMAAQWRRIGDDMIT